MTRRYVNEIAIGAVVDGVFMVATKELRKSRGGEPYLLLGLSDRTGTVAAYRFNPLADEIEVPVGGFVRVRGRMGLFRGRRRITIDALAVESEIDPSDFLERSLRPTDEMVAELRERVRSVRDRRLARLLRALFADRAAFERFSTSPLRTTGPYARIGGLLEHTLAVTGACAAMAEHHPNIDADLLVAAAIVHDVGTIDAVAFDSAIRHTDEGRLLGHELLTDRRIMDAARRASLPENDPVLMALRHAVAVHHADDAPASAALRPATLEAAALASADAANLTLAALSHRIGAAVRVGESWSDTASRPLYSGPFIAVENRAATA